MSDVSVIGRFRFLLILAAVSIAGCASRIDAGLSYVGAPGREEALFSTEASVPSTYSTIPRRQGGGSIFVGSFNIRDFGKRKAENVPVMRRLAEIVRKHDVIAIQEISDKSETVPATFLDYINADGSRFAYVLSPRTGLAASEAAKEQYAVFYDTKTIEVVKDLGIYDDRQELFQREPQVAQFKARSGGYTFAIINVHTQPTRAVAEIGGLHEAAKWTRTKLGDVPLIIIGDFNGGCTYAKPAKLDAFAIRGPDYTWVCQTRQTLFCRKPLRL